MKGLATIFFCLLCFTAWAQDLAISVLTVPPTLRENAGSVVRSYDMRYEVLSDNQATIYVRKVVTLLNRDHDRENQLVVHYDNDSKITRFAATLYDELGTKVRTVKKSEIEDYMAISGGQFYTDSRVQVTTLSHPTYPYTIEFEYEKKLSNFGIVEFPRWLPMDYGQSVEAANFVALIPKNNKLLYRSNELPEPTVTDASGKMSYTWRVENLAARKPEVMAPPMTQTMPYLHTGLERFNVGRYQGSLNSWQAFGAFMNQLLAGRNALPAELKRLVGETTAGLTTDREKIAALYRLLQGRTRYVGVQLGVGGWQPFSAEYVEENRYGDCKALSNYLGAMLSEVGIPSYPVLIDWSDRQFYPVEEDFTTSAFNHMVLYVPSEDMYLECTSSTSPPGYLGDGKQDRNVLWVTPEGGALKRTPALEPAENGHVRSVALDLASNGDAEFRMRAAYYGVPHEDFRELLHHEQNSTKQLEILQNWADLPDVTGSGYRLECDPDQPVARLDYTTKLTGYARTLGERSFVPLNKYFNYDEVPDKLSARQFPIVRNEARFYVDSVYLKVPNELEVESLGDPVITHEHAAGEYRSEVKMEPGQLLWIRTLKLLPVQLPATDYESFRQFFVDVAKADRRQVVLRKKRT